ncbi:ankyrin repeat domain-containing protein [Hydrogenimonas sp.]
MNKKNIELIEAVKNDALDRAKALLAEGADVNIADEEGRPLLLRLVVSRGSRELAELLLEHGADIFWTTDEGVGLLDEAVERNRIDLAELFIDKGIDPAKSERKSGMTALMLAASFDYVEMMELLYKRGADLYAADEMGFTAEDFARKLRKKRSLEWIREKSGKHPPEEEGR